VAVARQEATAIQQGAEVRSEPAKARMLVR